MRPAYALAAEARYREKNRAEINRKRRERYASNPQKDLAYTKLWRARPENQCRLKSYQEKRKADPAYIEKHRKESREYAASHSEQNKERSRKWREQNLERHMETVKKNYQKRMADPAYRAALNQKNREVNRAVKALVFAHYGGNCACCEESSIEFLCIDHINGNGNEHRRAIKISGGTSFYHWLKRNGFPPGYQVLCHNCNMAKACYGKCPHQKGRD